MSFYALGFTDPTTVSQDWGGVRELAVHYLSLIKGEQPHGPYFVGGYSYGGLVAYEIASLLTEQKQRVEFVAMIDTFPWLPRSQAIRTRLTSMFKDKTSPLLHVEVCVVGTLHVECINFMSSSSSYELSYNVEFEL